MTEHCQAIINRKRKKLRKKLFDFVVKVFIFLKATEICYTLVKFLQSPRVAIKYYLKQLQTELLPFFTLNQAKIFLPAHFRLTIVHY